MSFETTVLRFQYLAAQLEWRSSGSLGERGVTLSHACTRNNAYSNYALHKTWVLSMSNIKYTHMHPNGHGRAEKKTEMKRSCSAHHLQERLHHVQDLRGSEGTWSNSGPSVPNCS